MKIPAQGIDIDSEKNLYLVANKLKPASLILFSPCYFNKGYDGIKIEGGKKFYETSYVKLKPEDITQFRESVGKLCIFYHQGKIEPRPFDGGNRRVVQIEEVMFEVGKDKESLDKLVVAKTDKEIGLALGYPTEAAEAFGKKINGETRNGHYCEVALIKAQEKGIEIPTWLAYISHVPEELDLVNRNISESSRELGKKYQDFIKKNNPKLAKGVEQDFLRYLLKKYIKTADGDYLRLN